MQLIKNLESNETYQALKRSLRRKKGFGLFFVIATPIQGKEIIQQLEKDLSYKTIEVLTLTEETPNLFEKIEVMTKEKSIDSLVISGIEKSLDPYVKSDLDTENKYGGRGDYYKLNEDSTPPLLSHLNLQRDRFKKTFHFPLIFLLSPFAYRFIIRRASDFFDWRSGIFEFPVDSQEIEMILSEGDVFYLKGDYEEAIVSYDKAIEFKPDYHQAWYNRGVTLNHFGKLEEAVISYDKAIEFKPDYYEAWNNRGNVLGNLGRLDEAIFSFDKAIEFKPDYHEAWSNRGVALSELGRLDEAMFSCDKAIEFKPDCHEVWNNRGNVLGKLGRLDEAIFSYDKAIQFKPNYDLAWNNRGNALRKLGRLEEAIFSYDKAIQFKPDDNKVWNNRGVVLSELGRLEEAISSYDKAIQFRPDDDKVWNNRGIALRKLGRLEEAIQSVKKSIEITRNPQSKFENYIFKLTITVLRIIFLVRKIMQIDGKNRK